MHVQIQRYLLPVPFIILLSLLLRVVFLGNHDLLTEEAYYWNYAAHLDFGYLDHPPLVAMLIKLSTTFLGVNEFAVRCPALFCWGISAYFIYRWSELIQVGAGQFSLLFLSILPFFFLNSCITTPDMPLLAAWAGALYFLYQALSLQKARAWYGAAVCIGLGLLAKYSIALLIMTTGLYLLANREQRGWLLRKEPYYAGLLILLIFSPVIYWNATHNWISFAFQSTRRLQGSFYFSLHHLLGILILFLTPIGIVGSLKLLSQSHRDLVSPVSRQFIQVFAFMPLLVFAVFSCFRAIKLDWLGPCLLAFLPWLSCMVTSSKPSVRKQWLITAPILLGIYGIILSCLSFGKPVILRQLFDPLLTVSWKTFTQEVSQIAASTQQEHAQHPIIIPLDTYRLESEFAFYQHKMGHVPFSMHHAADFGFKGLMYELWDHQNIHGKIAILIGKDKSMFDSPATQAKTLALSRISSIQEQNQHAEAIPYYYRIVRVL